MKCKNILIIAFFAQMLFALQSAGQKYPTGLDIEHENFNVPKAAVSMKFSAAQIGEVFSMRPNCPTPGFQGEIGSCVGFAVGFGACSILYNIQHNITDQQKKDQMVLSAMYIYNQVLARLADANCHIGITIGPAMMLVKTKGDCRYASFKPNDCHIAPTSENHREAANYKIKDYCMLFDPTYNAQNKVASTIQSLAGKRPVIIGMLITSSFLNLKGKLYKPNDKQEMLPGGHALVVIGYDNKRKTFEIMNSWGTTDWGDHGFFEMSYDDYNDLVMYGFQAYIGGGTEEREITGNFHFKKFTGTDANTGAHVFTEIAPTLSGNIYTVQVNKGEYFRVMADHMMAGSYVYVFSYKPDKSVEILFPEDKSFGLTKVELPQVPIVPSTNISLTIPDDANGGFVSDQAGEDYLCVLYSAKSIDNIRDLVSKVKSSSNADFFGKLQEAFGDKLVNAANVSYNPIYMGVKANVGEAYIVPIVMKGSVN